MPETRSAALAPAAGAANWFFGGLHRQVKRRDAGGAFCLSEHWYPRGVATPVHAQTR
jgi:hypothetical protein